MAMGPPMEPPPDTVEGRVGLLEHTLYDVHGRLARAEEANAFMAHKCQSLMENLLKCYQVRKRGLSAGPKLTCLTV